MFPVWASKDHPIVQREVALWQKRSRPWRWAWIFVFIIPFLCSSLCGLSTFITVADNPTSNRLLAGIISLITITGIALWILHSFMMLAIWILTSIGTATVIARERETQNWALLRITPLKIQEVVAAKIIGVLRWLTLPIGFTFVLRVLITFVGWIVVISSFYAASQGANTLTPEIKLGIALGSVPLAIITLIYFTVDLITNIAYSSSIGLLASSFSRTSATAVVITLVLNFVTSFFIIVPIQQAVYMVTSVANITLIKSSNPALVILFPIISFVLILIVNVAIQIGVSVFAYFLAINQAQRIVD